MSMQYRLYSQDDFAKLYAIEEVCFEPPERFSRRYLLHLVDRSNTATWLAEENDRMAGFAIVEWSHHSGAIRAYLQTIEVSPELRGCGIGKQLLGRAEDSARTAGSAWIWLHVNAENSRAVQLYEANNYVHAGREENYYAQGCDALIYRKLL